MERNSRTTKGAETPEILHIKLPFRLPVAFNLRYVYPEVRENILGVRENILQGTEIGKNMLFRDKSNAVGLFLMQIIDLYTLNYTPTTVEVQTEEKYIRRARTEKVEYRCVC
jgi:hypothetical protein